MSGSGHMWLSGYPYSDRIQVNPPGRRFLISFQSSNHIRLVMPAAKQITMSKGWSTANRNNERRYGTYIESPSTATAPATTHHSAGLGARSVERMIRVHERLARISIRFATTRVENVNARAFAA